MYARIASACVVLWPGKQPYEMLLFAECNPKVTIRRLSDTRWSHYSYSTILKKGRTTANALF